MHFLLSKRGIFFATSLVAMYFVCASFYGHWYSSTYSAFAGHERLAGFKPGDSFDEVADHYLRSHQVRAIDAKNEKVLHSGGFMYASPSLIGVLKNEIAEMEPGDELHNFEPAYGGGSFLQFRDGKLIKFSPKTFQATVHLANLNHEPVPNAMLRFGVLPFYLPFAALLFYCFYRLHRRLDVSQNSDGASCLAV